MFFCCFHSKFGTALINIKVKILPLVSFQQNELGFDNLLEIRNIRRIFVFGKFVDDICLTFYLLLDLPSFGLVTSEHFGM